MESAQRQIINLRQKKQNNIGVKYIKKKQYNGNSEWINDIEKNFQELKQAQK